MYVCMYVCIGMAHSPARWHGAQPQKVVCVCVRESARVCVRVCVCVYGDKPSPTLSLSHSVALSPSHSWTHSYLLNTDSKLQTGTERFRPSLCVRACVYQFGVRTHRYLLNTDSKLEQIDSPIVLAVEKVPQ